ncbi:MAG: hypothetical protein NTW29_22295 [Bacteroidetes bacterium]|nr:hypothetical protein [Bacteroidota bacterium]
MQPFIDITVYCYNSNKKKWTETRSGVLFNKRSRLFGLANCAIHGGTTNTIYVRVNISSLSKR